MQDPYPRKNPVTVMVIESLSYTGITWINLVIGCHQNAIAIGPPDRVMQLPSADNARRIHGSDCASWQGFFTDFDQNKNFFIQLADCAKRDTIIINNLIPSGAALLLRHPDMWMKRIRVVKDALALFSSWIRHHAEAKISARNQEHRRQCWWRIIRT